MPYCFGSAGGNVVINPVVQNGGGPAAFTSTTAGTTAQAPIGVVQYCAAGCGRYAQSLLYSLWVCDLCEKNIHFGEANGTIGPQPNLQTASSVLSYIITNKNTNLRGT